jgi:hypothetical protein
LLHALGSFVNKKAAWISIVPESTPPIDVSGLLPLDTG